MTQPVLTSPVLTGPILTGPVLTWPVLTWLVLTWPVNDIWKVRTNGKYIYDMKIPSRHPPNSHQTPARHPPNQITNWRVLPSDRSKVWVLLLLLVGKQSQLQLQPTEDRIWSLLELNRYLDTSIYLFFNWKIIIWTRPDFNYGCVQITILDFRFSRDQLKLSWVCKLERSLSKYWS